MTDAVAVGLLTAKQLDEMLQVEASGVQWAVLERAPSDWLSDRGVATQLCSFANCSSLLQFERGVVFGEAAEIRWRAIGDHWQVRRVGAPLSTCPLARTPLDLDVTQADDRWIALWGTKAIDWPHPPLIGRAAAVYGDAQLPRLLEGPDLPARDRLAIQVRIYCDNRTGQPILWRCVALGVWP